MTGIDWHEVVCIASGPSLTQSDCDAAAASGMAVVAVNNTWQRVPGCDVLYAGDHVWWRHNDPDIDAQKWTACEQTARHKHLNHRRNPFGAGYCSGLLALELACWKGAKRVVLLGYDNTTRRGLHWHGRHARTSNPTEALCKTWARNFEKVATMYPDTEITNASRDTVLTCFPRAELHTVLA